MSFTDNNNDKTDIVSVCTNCGKGEEENHKLKSCTACKLVKYCSRDCQIAHRPQHKKECKRRAAELHDEKLFKQPPPADDCPICFLRLPALGTGYGFQICCGKSICSGCYYSPVYDNQGNEVDSEKCPYCRTPDATSEDEAIEREMRRVEADDAEAIHQLGYYYRDGRRGFPKDYTKALELFHQAGELGFAKAYVNIGYAYDRGHGVEVDKKKAVYYWELAAMMGNETARHNLGSMEARTGNMDRAFKHFMIAVRSGDDDSLNKIKQLYTIGQASKDDYTKALQAYQEYLGEIKSPQRDKAAAADEKYRYY